MFWSQKMKKDFNALTIRMNRSERLPWESSLLKWQQEITERGHRIFQTERHINRLNRILILKEGLLGKCDQEILQQQMRHLSRSQTSLRTCKILWNITYIQDPGSTIVTCANLPSFTTAPPHLPQSSASLRRIPCHVELFTSFFYTPSYSFPVFLATQ